MTSIQIQIAAALGLAVGVISGCSNEGNPHGPCDLLGGPSTATATFGGIDYKVVGGFSGRGDGTSLQIQRDGSVMRETQPRGAEQGQLDQVTLDNLIADARSAEFPTLCAVYPWDGADDFVDEVTVHFDDSVFVVRASQFGDPPDRLQALIDTLRQIVDRPL
jgi:hypothetical protein